MSDELENQAAAYVGHLIFSFSRLDFMLALAIRNLTEIQSSPKITSLIKKLSFKDRLDCLQQLIQEANALPPQATEEFRAWHANADRLRTIRNAFVHGRWGIQTHSTLFNASSKFDITLSGESKIFSIDRLKSEADFARLVLNNFDQWHRKYVVDLFKS